MQIEMKSWNAMLNMFWAIFEMRCLNMLWAIFEMHNLQDFYAILKFSDYELGQNLISTYDLE